MSAETPHDAITRIRRGLRTMSPWTSQQQVNDVHALVTFALESEKGSPCPDCARLRADLAAMSEKLPCWHRKVDMDDSYGGCILCGLKKSHDEGDAEEDRLEAALAAAEESRETLRRENERLRAALTAAAATIQQAADKMARQCAFDRPHDHAMLRQLQAAMRILDAALSPLPPAAPEPERGQCPDPECGCRSGGYCDRPVREKLLIDRTLAKLALREPAPEPQPKESR